MDSLERCGLRVDPYGAGQGSQVCLRCVRRRETTIDVGPCTLVAVRVALACAACIVHVTVRVGFCVCVCALAHKTLI